VEVTEYHSGTHRGSIRIPEERRGAGWSVFEFQVRKHFLGEIMKFPAAQGHQKRRFDEEVKVVGNAEFRNGRSYPIRQSRDSRSNKSARDLKPSIPLRDLKGRRSDSRVVMATHEPRPTRFCDFKWKPRSKTLCIQLEHGSRRKVTWIGLETDMGLKAQQGAKKVDGPEGSLVVKAQSVEGLGLEKIETQLLDKGGLVFHTKPMGLESFLKGSVSDSEGSGLDRSCEEVGMESGVDEWMGEGVCLSQPVLDEPILVEACLSMVIHCPATSIKMGTPSCSEKLEIESSNLPLRGFGELEDEVDGSPLVCEPLCQLLPSGSSPLAVEDHEVGGEVELHQNSKMVDRHMCGFSKFVGFLIDEFEEECLALFQRIEERRNLQKSTTSYRKPSKFGTKGTRELRNLVSSVNYERKQLCAR
jgi:hypothetical protein